MSDSRWYIETLDIFTNNAVSGALTELGGDTRAQETVITGGRTKLLFEVPYSLIQRMQASLNDLPLRFRVWQKKADEQRAHAWKFHKITRKSAKVRKVADQLATLRTKDSPAGHSK